MRLPVMVSLIALVVVSTALADTPPQDYRARFVIVAPNDTAFTIVLADARWVKQGMTGSVVNPSQRDEVVAQFRVASVSERTATATVTGMVSGINVLHMAVITIPPRPWVSRHLWWMGAVAGLAIGFVLGKS